MKELCIRCYAGLRANRVLPCVSTRLISSECHTAERIDFVWDLSEKIRNGSEKESNETVLDSPSSGAFF